MTVHIDMTKPLSQRVVSVKLSDGRTLDPSRTYTVAANSFLADGGDGFTMLKRGKKKQEIGPDIDALVKYLESGAKISTKPPGRIVLDAGALPSDNH
jgi:2',3'-cyclic-nucleotide 2'-phosphodiesterase (5'-nucleotidase family)